MNLGLGLGLAVVSAALINTSFFLQHRASRELARLEVRHPFAALWTLFTDRAWLRAYGAGWLGWALYIVALRYAPLSLVQATAAGGLGLLALLSRAFGTPLTGRERAAACAAVVGLGLVCASLAVAPVSGQARPLELLVIVAAGLGAAGALIGVARQRLSPGAALGAASGLCYAVGDVATKGAVSGRGLVLVPVLIACNVAGFALLQLALQRGTVLATAGLSGLINGSLPIAVGVLVFAERLPSGTAGVARGLGFVLCVGGAVLLCGVGRQREPAEGGLAHPGLGPDARLVIEALTTRGVPAGGPNLQAELTGDGRAGRARARGARSTRWRSSTR